MLVTADSPLRRLPIGLDREQTLFLDGIRVSAEMLDLAYSRQVETLLRLAEPDRAQDDRAIGVVSALQDAWSVVDCTHRLRSLFRRIPRVKKKAPTIQVFNRATPDAEALRHIIQHLDSEIPKILRLGVPAWGTLQWLVLLDRTKFRMRTCTIAARTAFDAEHPVQNPAGKTMRATIDHVLLTAGGISLDLSDVFYEVTKVVRMVEKTLAERFAQLPTYGSDMVTTLEIEFAAEDEPAGAPTAVAG